MASKTRSQHNAEYWDIASKYWNDIATVNPHWAWNYYKKRIPDKKISILVLGVTNGLFLSLLKEFRPKAWICGIDFSFGMLKQAHHVEKNVICCRGDCLPFKDESFDMVLSDYFLSVIREAFLKGTINEVERVLKVDGILVAKELRHRGHMVLWVLFFLLVGVLCLLTALLLPSLSLLFSLLFILALLGYNPLQRKMGKSATFLKFFLHLFKIIIRRKHIPTRKEVHELYYLSKKYLHIFAEEELEQLFSVSSLNVDLRAHLGSWNFSIKGVKQ